METASSKKLAFTSKCSSRNLRLSQPRTSSDSESSEAYLDYKGKMKGYRLVDCKNLLDAIMKISVCNGCGAPLTVRESLVSRRGLVSKLMICCTNTRCGKKAAVCDPYATKSKLLNTRSVMSMRAIGRGLNPLQSFCAMMDMLPPVTGRAYRDHY